MTDSELSEYCQQILETILIRQDCAEMHEDARNELEAMNDKAREWQEFYRRPDIEAVCALTNKTKMARMMRDPV